MFSETVCRLWGGSLQEDFPHASETFIRENCIFDNLLHALSTELKSRTQRLVCDLRSPNEIVMDQEDLWVKF